MNKKRSKISVIFRLLKLVGPLSGYMCFSVICGTLSFLAVQFIPILGGWGVLYGMGEKIPFSVKTVFVLLPVFALLRAVLRYSEQKTNHYIAFTLLAIVRDKVFRALRRLCPAKLEGRDKGDLISLITSDVELLEVFYAHTISPIFIAIATETVMVLFIGAFHPILGLIALAAFLTVGVLVPIAVSKVSGDSGDRIRGQAGQLSAFVLENIRGLSEIIQFGIGKKRLEEMNKKTDDLTEAQGRLSYLTGLSAAISNFIILVYDVLMPVVALILFNNDEIRISGVIIPSIALMSSFGPVAALAGLGTTLQNTVASGSRILDILDEKPETEDVVDTSHIEFTGAGLNSVDFTYGGEKVLQNVSLTFPENKIIGIMGKSGSGKSTMLKLLMRFWETTNGKVTISGININKVNTSNLRDIESYMTQETEMFTDSIANNLRIAKEDATSAELIEACKKASVHDFIMTLPERYETNVGELGDTLSDGEKQRIGLARAFLHNAPLVLLDEPTSNLDSLNEAVILKALKDASEGKTYALVSHRRSTLKIADEVYELGSGSGEALNCAKN